MNDPSKRIAGLSPEEKRALLARLLRERAQSSREWSALSHDQRALWFLYRLAPESAAYNLLYAARLRSSLDIDALQRAVDTLLQRYPILTATFAMRDGEPVQRFHKDQKIQVAVIDAAGRSPENLQRRLIEEANRPFDLEQGPILRIKLYKRDEQDYILALNVHHIAADFWALDILVDELCILYAANRAGIAAPLPEPGTQYPEYVRQQAEMLAGAEGERLWAYWREKLSGELPLLNLPTDRPRPLVQTYRGAVHSFALSDDLAWQLRALANAEKVTLFTLLLAAYQTLLFRYTNQEDILVGTPMLGRNRAEYERVIGYLANPVVLRADLSGNPTFKEFLRQAGRTVIEALEHQDYPFPLLVERLQPRRDPSYSPIFQTEFIWDRPRTRNAQAMILAGQDGMARQLAQENLVLEPFAYGQQGAPFDLTLTIFELEGGLSADFRYNVDLFDAATIERMEQHFQMLLAGIVANPEQRLRDLPLLTEAELHRILVDWNATESDYPGDVCLHQLIEAQVERTPEQTALIFEDQALSYRELNRRANRLAHALQAWGVEPDVLVGVCMERSIEMVVALLAILKAGGAYVPLDPGYPQERLAYMLQDAQAPVLLTQSAIAARLPRTEAKVVSLDSDWGEERAGHDENPISGVQPDNLIYMIYTSGSTGKPKGALNIHRGLCNRLHWMQQAYRLTPDDRVLQKTPFSFDVSAWEFFWPLMTGASLVVARPGGQQDTAYLAELIERQRITTLHFVPSMLQAFLLEPDLERRCKTLRHVVCSGEALSFELQERFFARLPAALHNLYGPTEASIDVTYWECQPGQPVTIGRPIANTRIYILDQAGHPVPVGVAGELYLGGVGLARGYHNRPDLTAERFVPDPFSKEPGARLYRTGDLARYRADGAVEFLGRIDQQVKIRGFRIELGEIEAALVQHPAIAEAVVTAREDTPGNRRLVAYIVATQEQQAEGTAPSIETLRSFLQEKLPYYMVPAAFVFLEALPLLPNGKVDRKALPAPDMTRPDLEKAFVAPRTPVEETLAGVWREVLGLDKVGVHDNFFDLGGASIQSLEIISKAGEAGLQLSLEMLFEHQTIAELAAALGSGASEPAQAEAKETPQSPSTHTEVQRERPPAPAERSNMYIESLGVYLPPKAVSTEEILQNCTRPIRFPLARLTGIKHRRMAGETEFSIDLARKAVEQCLASSKYNPEDIDLLICGNISRCDRPGLQFTFEPGTAVRLQHYFGFKNAIVFDIDNACTGLFTAAYIIEAFLKAGLIRRGMAVSGEYISHLTLTAQKELEGFMDSRLACLTVGDAGAAMILENAPDKKIGFHEFEMFTLGSYSKDCIGKVTYQPHGGAIMYTDAVRVSAVNMKYAVAHAANIIERSGWPYDAFQHVIIHQTSGTTIRDAAREINSQIGKEVCTPENVINNIAERGNTATTTQMVAVMDHIRSGRINAGDNAVFGITGSGATIGAAVYTFDDLPDRLRRIEAGEYTPEKVSPQPRVPALLPPTRRVRVAGVGTMPLDTPGERKTLEMVKVAAENCLTMSSYSHNDIDLLIFSGIYRDEFLCEPAVAALVAGEMDINGAIETPQDKKTFAFDVFNGAIGTLNACHAAIGMMLGGKVGNALVVASEVENNRETAPEEVLGIEETGSALMLDESPDGRTGFGNFVFKYFTGYVDAQISHSLIRDGVTLMHSIRDPHLEDYYLQCIQEAVRELLDLEGLDMSRISVVLPPQISSAFVARLADALGVCKEKVVDVQAEHDLFTSSLAYSFQQVFEQQQAKPGDIGLVISVGSGIQVGCATYYF